MPSEPCKGCGGTGRITVETGLGSTYASHETNCPMCPPASEPIPDVAGAMAFLDTAARYFENRPIKGEDRAHWSNVYNAENCRQAAALLSAQAVILEEARKALTHIRNEAERENGSWTHLKRCIAVQSRDALAKMEAQNPA